MTSIGNDIVDLHHINAERSQSKRFYNKFITESEIALYHSIPADRLALPNFVWLLWSIKESGFKLLQRHQQELVFSPTKFIVDRIDLPADALLSADLPAVLEATGFTGLNACHIVAHFGGVTFYARSIINQRYIATVALPFDRFEDVVWGIKITEHEEPASQSADVRRLLLNRVKNIFSDGNYVVQKNTGGCPLLFSGDAEMDWMISFAHHGGVVGYVAAN